MRSNMIPLPAGAGLVLVTSTLAFAACSSTDPTSYNTLRNDGIQPPSDPSSATATSSGTTDGGQASSTGTTGAPVGIDVNQGSMMVEETECASADTPTSLQKVVLAFVFDVSASMGSEDQPYYSRALKWDPVVSATKAFFSDPESAGISATLTFFPNELADLIGGDAAATTTTTTTGGMPPGGGGVAIGGESCEASGYATPDVGLTALPSDAFALAIDAVTPPDNETWRLGTPTLPAIEGTVQAIEALRAMNPDTRYSIVLVTDGMPALCQTIDDSVQDVADAVAAVADVTPTYVIGVENPVTTEVPNPPDSVSGMHQVAEAGGTGSAFLIDTNDPVNTATQLKAIIDSIREANFSCSIAIPAPPGGETFDQNKVNVQFTSAATGEVPYTYDPTCSGTNGWYYDDEANPTSIELCASVCDSLRAAQQEGQLSVEFGCKTRIE